MSHENLWVPEQVTSLSDGTREQVMLARCLDCESETFIVYLVGAQQLLHLQCAECSNCFCAGHECSEDDGLHYLDKQ